jgi:hypothetical protein
MSKFNEAIATYKSFMGEKLEMKNINEGLLTELAQLLGPAIYDADASLVACSDKGETGRVKELFLIKELGLENTPKLDEAIQAVCKQMGTSNRKKFRVVFYYLLLEFFGMKSYGKAAVAETKTAKKATAKKEVVAETVTTVVKEVKATTKKVAETAVEVKETVAPKSEAVVTKTIKSTKRIYTPITFTSFEEQLNYYKSFIYNDIKFNDIQPELLADLIHTAGGATIVETTSQEDRNYIKNNFLIGRLGLENNDELDEAINLVNTRLGNLPKYRPVFYYLLTKHTGREWVITEPTEAVLF